MSEQIPLDIVRMVGGLILNSDYRNKVDVAFQYDLADLISKLVMEERDRSARYLKRQADIHAQLAEEIVGGDTDNWHANMCRQFLDASEAIKRGAK